MALRTRHFKYVEEDVFIKKPECSVKNSKSMTIEYKLLLYLNFFWQLPYVPIQLDEKHPKEKRVYLAITVLNITFKTMLSIPVVLYARLLFPYVSVTITFTLYLVLSLALSWTVFLKRHHIMQAMKWMLALSNEIHPRNFKSKWNVYLFLFFNVCGFTLFSVTTALVSMKLTYPMMNSTSEYFFWYKITEEYERTFSKVLVIVASVVFTQSGLACGLVLQLSSTLYFHFGDIILNFGTKLKKKLEHEEMDKYFSSQTLHLFKEIMHLNDTINRAVSLSVLLTYGAMVSIFFTGVCSIQVFGFEMLDIILLDLAMYMFSLYGFLSMTLTGDRVKGKYEEFKNGLTSRLIFILNRYEKDKEIEWYRIMAKEIRSHNLCVTGGNMFVISNSVILTIGGSLITYGVIIFQMG